MSVETFLQLQKCPEAFLACLLVWYSQTAGRILDQERAVEISLDGMSVNLLRKLFDAQFHNYWEGNTPLTMLPMTEATFGKIRHGAGEALFSRTRCLRPCRTQLTFSPEVSR